MSKQNMVCLSATFALLLFASCGGADKKPQTGNTGGNPGGQTTGEDPGGGGGECTPNCEAVACGDDGCGGSCGDCVAGTECQGGYCIGETPPETWECSEGYYNATDGCDCACGAFDPDCLIEEQSLYGCSGMTEPACNAAGECVPGVCECGERECGDDGCGNSCGECEGGLECDGGRCVTPPPEGWTCSPGYFDSSDGCDCDCGAYDPDCGEADSNLYGCSGIPNPQCNSAGVCEPSCSCEGLECGDDGCGNVCGTCAEGQECQSYACITPPPEGWTCPAFYFDDAEYCDCNCGAPDVDCANPELPIFGCETEGARCNGSVCEEAPGGGDPPG